MLFLCHLHCEHNFVEFGELFVFNLEKRAGVTLNFPFFLRQEINKQQYRVLVRVGDIYCYFRGEGIQTKFETWNIYFAALYLQLLPLLIQFIVCFERFLFLLLWTAEITLPCSLSLRWRCIHLWRTCSSLSGGCHTAELRMLSNTSLTFWTLRQTTWGSLTQMSCTSGRPTGTARSFKALWTVWKVLIEKSEQIRYLFR